MKYQPIAGVLLVAILALAGCGSDDTTTGPDTAPPLAPQVTHGYCKDGGKVVLTWSPNVESDLAGYYIYVSGQDHKVGMAGMQQRATVLVNQPRGDIGYYMTAVDRSGNESAPSALLLVHVAEPPGPELSDFMEVR